MQVEGITGTLANTLAGQVSYLQMSGLQNVANPRNVNNNSGVRSLNENPYAGMDLYQLLKLLNISANKYLILKLLSRFDLIHLLYLLDKDLLLNGLHFLSKEKLLRLLMYLPKRLLMKILLYLFPMEVLLKGLPTEELIHILRSKRLPMSQLAKGMQYMPIKYMRELMQRITGRKADHLSQDEMISMFRGMKKENLLEGLKHISFKGLIPYVTGLVKEDPELLQRIHTGYVFKLFEKTAKSALIDALQVLDNGLLIQMLSNLPDKFLAQVVSQIDDSTFAQYLMSQQPQLLATLAAGMAA